MSVSARDAIAPAGAGVVPVRPSWLMSVLLDALLGVGAYIAVVLAPLRQRTAGGVPSRRLVDGPAGGRRADSGARRRAGVHAEAEGELAVAGRRRRRAGHGGVGAARCGSPWGSRAISRMAFVADALLLSIAAIGWRGAWVLRARARARAVARASVADLVDRADEMTLGSRSREPLPLPEPAEDARPQGSQVEVPRLGVRLSLVAGQPAADDRRLHARLHVHPRDAQRDVRLLPDARASWPGRSSPAPS